MDGVEPSINGISALNLKRLALMLDNTRFAQMGDRIVEFCTKSPSMLNAMTFPHKTVYSTHSSDYGHG